MSYSSPENQAGTSRKASWKERITPPSAPGISAMDQAQKAEYYRIPPLGEIIPPLGWVASKCKKGTDKVRGKVTETTMLASASLLGGAGAAATTSFATDGSASRAVASAAGGAALGRISQHLTERKTGKTHVERLEAAWQQQQEAEHSR